MHRFRIQMPHWHAARAAMSTPPAGPGEGKRHKLLWFVALWCAGVAGALLLALPFRLLMDACMR